MKFEATGKTVEAATQKALNEAGLTQEEAEIEVLSEGGLFKQCKVAVWKKETDGDKVKAFLETVLEKMKFDDAVVEAIEDEEGVKVNIATSDQGNLIGYRGEVLAALQYLSGIVLSNENKNFKRVTIDCEGYREKREKTLVQLAKNLEQKVKRTGRPVKLEPMNPYERRIIHTTLQGSEYVTTESEGVQNGRHVVISPKGKNDILNAPTGNRKTLNFVYRSDKKRRKHP